MDKSSCFSGTEIKLIKEQAVHIPFRVLTVDNPEDLSFLRKKSDPISPDYAGEEFRFLLDRMLETLIQQEGVGLAAPQIGVAKRIFMFLRLDKSDIPVQVVINPEIINHPQKKVRFEKDGCLSIPGENADTERYPWIDVEYTDHEGNRIRERLDGYSRSGNFAAVIFQHELDHLDGILYTDRIIKN